MFSLQAQVSGTPYVFESNQRAAICDGTQPTTVVEITSLYTGKIWMDRDLGASRVATSATDYYAYGCLYQWGRGNDGHASMIYSSSTSASPINGNTTTLSSSNLDLGDPSRHGLFIKSISTPYDWRSPQNDLLWQGVGGTNNPCPTGFRIPTNAEFSAECSPLAYNINSNETAYSNGPNGGFKFVAAGSRRYDDGSPVNVGRYGYYWSSTSYGTRVYYGDLMGYAPNNYFNRSSGYSVRCIKDIDAKPTLSTTAVTSITAMTAIGGGNVLTEGSNTITNRGVCWATTPAPTTADNKTNEVGTTGMFSSNLTGLSVGTVYYVRAYAINIYGTSYGEEVSFSTPIDAVCDGSQPTTVVEITSMYTGKIWMDRNLGASRAAISATDYAAYGCLYQWGRGNDGHASISWTSSTAGTAVNGSTATLSSSNLDLGDPARHALFITGSDWRNPQNDVLWQGAGSINNPCPTGYRVPSDAEFTAELASNAYNITNAAKAYSNGPNDGFKFVLSGFRLASDASISFQGNEGDYWSSTVSGTNATSRNFNSVNTYSNNVVRANGYSVRCLKDTSLPSVTTTSVTSIATTTAISGGNVLTEGSDVVTARGVCWSTTPAPTIANNKTIEIGTTGVFSSSLTGLSVGTVYYVRAYATTSSGTAYGVQMSFGTIANAICDGTQPTTVVEITSLYTGKIWMDRNLGASRAATSSTDYAAYGCLYQWGRGNDGHASIRWASSTSASAINGSTTTLAGSNLDLGDPSRHGLYIKSGSSPYYDWRSPQNDLLWQGAGSINNPCPTGYHVPTITELHAEFDSGAYNITNAATAYSNGPNGGFKFVVAGMHSGNSIVNTIFFTNQSSLGSYSSSTVSGTEVYSLSFGSSGLLFSNNVRRGVGNSVRCIKD